MWQRNWMGGLVGAVVIGLIIFQAFLTVACAVTIIVAGVKYILSP